MIYDTILDAPIEVRITDELTWALEFEILTRADLSAAIGDSLDHWIRLGVRTGAHRTIEPVVHVQARYRPTPNNWWRCWEKPTWNDYPACASFSNQFQLTERRFHGIIIGWEKIQFLGENSAYLAGFVATPERPALRIVK